MPRKKADTIPIKMTGAILGEYRVLVYRKATAPGFMIDCTPLTQDKEVELELEGGKDERKSRAGNNKRKLS